MARIFASVLSLRRNPDHGATAVEYGLTALLIGIAIIGAVTLLGGNLTTLYQDAAGSIP